MAVGANFRDEHVRRSVTTSQNCTSKHQDISYALAAVATTVQYGLRTVNRWTVNSVDT